MGRDGSNDGRDRSMSRVEVDVIISGGCLPRNSRTLRVMSI